MIFNPVRIRESVNEAGIKRLLGTEFDTQRPMGNVAIVQLNEIIRLYLVGMREQVSPLLSKRIDWIKFAIEENENFGESGNFHQQSLRWALAIGIWMRDGVNAADVWGVARDFNASALFDKSVFSKNELSTGRLDDYMPLCCQSEKYEAGMIEYEKYSTKKNISLKGTLKPRDFGYAICLHELYGRFDKGDILNAGRKMLKANLENNWLGSGQYLVAATWLKIVYWSETCNILPGEIILKAYEDMPNVPRPTFV
ncbi:hypothetical protein [Rugamonas sp. DEMB1]|uniref:hypothetical protein n=1 Tax=Rugamonas sp. DEMB1 TaxID=3039386 RepID=UPI0024495882|nr:hypothetical protein [Rugamonas sp. DEMB1]WGG52763.1 hypothetical protein QC826_11825 [Rugamonas sp. DEMB1]